MRSNPPELSSLFCYTRRVRRISAKAWLLAGASGGLQGLLFLSLDFSALSWVAVAPMLVAVMTPAGSGSPLKSRQGFLLGLLSGIMFYLVSCYWMYHVVATYGGVSKLLRSEERRVGKECRL